MNTDYPEWVSQSDTYIFDNTGSLFLYNISSSQPIQTPKNISEINASLENHSILSSTLSLGAANWTVVSVIPKNSHITTMLHLRKISIISLLICLLMFLIIVSIYSKHNYYHIAEMGALMGITETYPEYNALKKRINDLCTSNDSYSKKVYNQNSLLQDMLLSRMLNGNMTYYHSSLPEECGIRFPFNNFIVMLLYPEPSLSAPLTSELMAKCAYDFKSLLISKLPENEYVVNTTMESGRNIIIINTIHDASNYPEELKPIAEECCYQLSSESLTLIISKLNSLYKGLSKCYFEVLDASMYMKPSISPVQVFLCSELNIDNTDSFAPKCTYLPLNQENSFITYLQQGDYPHAKNELDEIYKCISQLPSKSHMECFMYDVICMFLKVPPIVGLDDTLANEFSFSNLCVYIHNIEES